MEKTIRVILVFVIGHLVGGQEIDALSELPLAELLTQKKMAEEGSRGERLPEASPVVGPPSKGDAGFKGLHQLPHRKTFYEYDDEDEKGHVHKKKEDHKFHDILNTSVMVLSYLAFGGYLLCMIASALREKRRRIMMPAPVMNNHFLHVLQNHMAHRPTRPFIRFPTVTVHQGGKKRRRRSTQREAPWGEPEGGSSPLFNIIDYIEVLPHGGN